MQNRTDKFCNKTICSPRPLFSSLFNESIENLAFLRIYLIIGRASPCLRNTHIYPLRFLAGVVLKLLSSPSNAHLKREKLLKEESNIADNPFLQNVKYKNNLVAFVFSLNNLRI